MNIGVINKREITTSNGAPHKYLEMSIRPPFMESATFTINPNKKKENSEKMSLILKSIILIIEKMRNTEELKLVQFGIKYQIVALGIKVEIYKVQFSLEEFYTFRFLQLNLLRENLLNLSHGPMKLYGIHIDQMKKQAKAIQRLIK